MVPHRWRRPAEERLLTWYQGVAHLVTMVVESTQAADAWDGHCRVVLTWFLNRWDVPHDRAQRLMEDAIAWQFRSWTTPSRSSIENLATWVAESLTEDDPATT